LTTSFADITGGVDDTGINDDTAAIIYLVFKSEDNNTSQQEVILLISSNHFSVSSRILLPILWDKKLNIV
jgi:hypothetical protein